MGCTDCSRSGGCGTRKAEERDLLAELLPTLYPTRRWGEPDDGARFGGGVGEREAARIMRAAAAKLEAPAYLRVGDDDENCHHIYVLCVGRAPGLVELRDGHVIDVPDGDAIRERYLRATVSTMARVATLQEVELRLDLAGDSYAIEERPRAGVFDPILLKRTRKLVDLLVGSGLDYLDFGLLVPPPLGYDGAAFRERFGEDPGLVSYLFYPHPPGVVSTTLVPRAAA